MTIYRTTVFDEAGNPTAILDERLDGVLYHQKGDQRPDAFTLVQVFEPFTQDEIAARAAEEQAWSAGSSRRDILAQIHAIEATVTNRRMREAALGTDDGWLADTEAEIAALRAQLS